MQLHALAMWIRLFLPLPGLRWHFLLRCAQEEEEEEKDLIYNNVQEM